MNGAAAAANRRRELYYCDSPTAGIFSLRLPVQERTSTLDLSNEP